MKYLISDNIRLLNMKEEEEWKERACKWATRRWYLIMDFYAFLSARPGRNSKYTRTWKQSLRTFDSLSGASRGRSWSENCTSDGSPDLSSEILAHNYTIQAADTFSKSLTQKEKRIENMSLWFIFLKKAERRAIFQDESAVKNGNERIKEAW